MINVAIELYIQRYYVKDGEKKTLMGVLLKKRKNVFNITALSALLGMTITFIFIIALVFGSGSRACPRGQYLSGLSCYSCSDALGSECDACSSAT